jgi:hypothetical protein
MTPLPLEITGFARFDFGQSSMDSGLVRISTRWYERSRIETVQRVSVNLTIILTDKFEIVSDSTVTIAARTGGSYGDSLTLTGAFDRSDPNRHLFWLVTPNFRSPKDLREYCDMLIDGFGFGVPYAINPETDPLEFESY